MGPTALSVLYDDKIEIYFNSPIKLSPDNSRGFTFYTEDIKITYKDPDKSDSVVIRAAFRAHSALFNIKQHLHTACNKSDNILFLVAFYCNLKQPPTLTNLLLIIIPQSYLPCADLFMVLE